MKTTIIYDLWVSYHNQVLPSNASDIQVIETRKAFYAGAYGLLRSLDMILDEGSEPTQQDINTLQGIYLELDDFIKRVK